MVAIGNPCDFIEKCEECGLVFQVVELICENDGSAHGIVMKTVPNYCPVCGNFLHPVPEEILSRLENIDESEVISHEEILEKLDLLCNMKFFGSLDVGTSSILKSWECSNCKQRTYSENLPYYCQNCGMEVRR